MGTIRPFCNPASHIPGNLILANPLNGNMQRTLAKKSYRYLNIQIFSRYDPPSTMEMETSIIAKSFHWDLATSHLTLSLLYF